MSEIQSLLFEMSQVRMIVEDEPWFLAQDVCSILAHSDTSKAVSRLDDDEKLMRTLFVSGQHRPVWFVNEAGLYGLVLTSRLPKAKQFKRWVKHEVLPSIRQTGSYNVNEPQSIEDLIIMQAQSVKELKSKVDNLSLQLQVQSHRIDTMDAVNTVGDMQQRLNAMIRKYAKVNGLTFQQAYREFRASYNMAYRTNITALIDNYKERYGLRELSMPEYVAHTGMLEDAIRVADKMLNPVGV